MRTIPALITASLFCLTLAACKDNSTNPGNKELSSGNIAAGAQFSHTFSTTGVYPYYCTVHPSCVGLMGTVTVVSAATVIPVAEHILAISQIVAGSCFALTAPATIVHVGDTVTWTNSTSTSHTVTSQ